MLAALMRESHRDDSMQFVKSFFTNFLLVEQVLEDCPDDAGVGGFHHAFTWGHSQLCRELWTIMLEANWDWDVLVRDRNFLYN